MDYNKIASIGYEDTDKKIEIDIYGIRFEINKSKIDENKDINKIEENEDIDKEIEELLGKGSIQKINKKREEDGYSKMTIDVKLEIFKFIYITFMKTISEGATKDVSRAINNEARKINEMSNRYNQRKYNRRYNNRRY